MARLFPCFLLISMLFSCSSGPSLIPPPANESLIPEISADGTKFFVFRRDYLRPQVSQDELDRMSPRPVGANPRGNRSMMGESDIEERLTRILGAVGYCREGFFELYREQTFQSFSVRGECREDASPEDLQRFSNGPIVLN
jgi:hypothetical protein